MRVGAIFGLGLAYAGSNRADVVEKLLPALAEADSKVSGTTRGVRVPKHLIPGSSQAFFNIFLFFSLI